MNAYTHTNTNFYIPVASRDRFPHELNSEGALIISTGLTGFLGFKVITLCVRATKLLLQVVDVAEQNAFKSEPRSTTLSSIARYTKMSLMTPKDTLTALELVQKQVVLLTPVKINSVLQGNEVT